MANTWVLEVRDLAGTVIVANALAKSPECNFAFALNSYGTLDFKLPTTDAATTQANYLPGGRTVHLKQNGTIVWGGFLLAADCDPDWTSFSCKSWEFALSQAVINTNRRFGGSSTIDQLDIAWTLVTNHVVLPTGVGQFTRASATLSGFNRQRTYCCDDGTTVFDAVSEMASSRNGFDFWVTAARAWTTTTTTAFRGTNRAATVILDDTSNFLTPQFSYDTEDVFNRLWFTPHNVGTCSDISYRDINDTPQTWVRESFIDLSDQRSGTDRIDIVYESLRNAQPKVQVTGTIDSVANNYAIQFGSFDLGDTVQCKLSRGYMTMNVAMKVMDYTVHLAEGRQESIDVTLDNLTTV